MRRVLFALVATFVCVMQSFGVPAERVKKSVEQEDGSLLTIVLNGDENFSYFTTADGVPVAERGGSYYLAEWSEGELVASEFLAHNSDMRGDAEQNFISENSTWVSNQIASAWGEKLQIANRLHSTKLTTRAEDSSKKLLKASAVSRKALVILVNFKDQSFKSTSTQSEISAMMNQEGYNRNGHIGSVHAAGDEPRSQYHRLQVHRCASCPYCGGYQG